MKSFIIFLVSTIVATSATATLEYSTRALTSTHEGECRSCCLCNDVYALKQEVNQQKKKIDEISTATKAPEDQKEILDQLKEIKLMLEQITSVPLPRSTPQPSTPPFTFQPTTAAVHTTTPGLVEIVYDGTAGASTSLAGYEAKYAFQNTANYWQSGTSIENGPSFVWFRFRTPHRLAKIGFQNGRNKYAPKSFEAVGSNDCSTWTTMFSTANSGIPNDYSSTFFSWNIEKRHRLSFSCIGIKIITLVSGNSVKHPEIKNIIMWEYR